MSDRRSEAFERALDEAGSKGRAPDNSGLARLMHDGRFSGLAAMA
jgi:hypothetical protein